MVDRNRLSHNVLPVFCLFGFACCLGEWRVEKPAQVSLNYCNSVSCELVWRVGLRC